MRRIPDDIEIDLTASTVRAALKKLPPSKRKGAEQALQSLVAEIHRRPQAVTITPTSLEPLFPDRGRHNFVPAPGETRIEIRHEGRAYRAKVVPEGAHVIWDSRTAYDSGFTTTELR